jgi:hypothetical protein
MDPHQPPPPIQMLQMLSGYQLSQALYVAASLGVADLLAEGPQSVEVLAEKTATRKDSLHRLLRSLASVGVFTETEPGTFATTPLGETLASNHPGSVRDVAIMWMETQYAPFGELLHTVRTGEPGPDHLWGKSFFDWLSERPEQVDRFSRAMANLTEGARSPAVAALPLDGISTLVDVGGADGTVLSLILAAHPDISGVLFDLPHVVAGAPRALEQRGVADRVRTVGGSFFESVPAADGYLLSMVLHDWADEPASQILRNVASSGGSGARLRLIEFVVPPGNTPHMSKMIDLTMLGILTGKERTEEQWRELLGSAGFGEIQISPTEAPVSVISATVK